MTTRSLVRSIQSIIRKDAGIDGDAQLLGQLCWMLSLKIISDQAEELRFSHDAALSPVPPSLRWSAWAADPMGMTGDELISFVNAKLFPRLRRGGRRRHAAPCEALVQQIFSDTHNYMKSGHLLRQVINMINEIDFKDIAARQNFGDIYEQLLADLQSAGNAGEYYTPRAITTFMVDRIDPKPGEVLLDPACGTGGFLSCAVRFMMERHVRRPVDREKIQQGLRAMEKKPLPHMLCATNMLLSGIEDPSFVRRGNALSQLYSRSGRVDKVDIVLTNPPFGGKEDDEIGSNFPRELQTRETADLFLALVIRVLRHGGRAAVVLPDSTLFGRPTKAPLRELLLQECNLHTVVRLPHSVFRPYASFGANLVFFEKGRPTREIWFYEHSVPEGQKAYSMTRPIRIEHLSDCIEWWGGPERKGRVETSSAWRTTAEEVRARGFDLDVKPSRAQSNDGADAVEMLAALATADAEAVRLRDELRAALAGALIR